MRKKDLLKLLEPFEDNVEIMVECVACKRSSSSDGPDNLIKIRDCTNQTFGYIELQINDSFVKVWE